MKAKHQVACAHHSRKAKKILELNTKCKQRQCRKVNVKRASRGGDNGLIVMAEVPPTDLRAAPHLASAFSPSWTRPPP